MIQKISFNGIYQFKNRYGTRAFDNDAQLPIEIIQDNIHHLKRGDSILLSHGQDGTYTIGVPNYMDKRVEFDCNCNRAIGYRKII